MKKTLSLILAVCMMLMLCTSLAIVPVSAAAIAADELDPAAFTATLKDANGKTPAVTEASVPAGFTLPADYNDEVGSVTYDANNKKLFAIESPKVLADGNTATKFRGGGNYSNAEGGIIKLNKLPFDLDINLGEAKTISGTRLYPRQEANQASGFVTKWDMFVKFSGDDDFTYLASGTNNTGNKDAGTGLYNPVETRMGYNLSNVTDVRFRILESTNMSADKANAYIEFAEVAVLSPNTGTNWKTFASADEIDEMMIKTPFAQNKDKGIKDASAVMNGNLHDSIFTNGTIYIDLGEEQTFSGLRVYTPQNKAFTASNFAGVSILPNGWTTNASGNANSATSYNIVSNAILTYPSVDGSTNRGPCAEIIFSNNYAGRYIAIASWSIFDDAGNVATSDNASVGEVRILKADGTKATLSPNYAYRADEYDTSVIASNVETGSNWNAGYSAAQVCDNNTINYWHSTTVSPVTDDQRTITFTFKEPTEVGGMRCYPRQDNKGGNPKEVRLYGSYDGITFFDMTGTVDTGNNSGIAKIADTLLPGRRNNVLKAIKYVVKKNCSGSTIAHTCLAELRVLKPSDTAVSDEVEFCYSPAVSVTTGVINQTSGNTSYASSTNILKLADGITNDSGAENSSYHWEADFSIYPTRTPAESAWVAFDLGQDYTFSAARVYARVAWPTQSITKGYIYVSDDGTNWTKSDLQTGLNSANRYANISTKFEGTNYNITARYIKVEAVQTAGSDGGQHWATDEITLVKPVESNTTYTVDELTEIYQGPANSVMTLINAIGTVTEDSFPAIKAARDAYDALSDPAKAFVTNYATLTQAEDDFREIAPNVVTERITALGEENTLTIEDKEEIDIIIALYDLLDEGQKAMVSEADVAKMNNAKKVVAGLYASVNITTSLGGLIPAYYTLSSTSPVASVSYNGETLDNTDHKWIAAAPVDGKIAFKLAGNPTGTTPYLDNGYTYVNDGLGGIKAGDPVTTESVSGSYVYALGIENEGDHRLTVTFEDNTTKDIILNTVFNWNLPTSPNIVAGNTDQIVPKATWKAAYSSNSANSDMSGLLFNGNITEAVDSGYLGAKMNRADVGNFVQVTAYGNKPITYLVDFGEETSLCGARSYYAKQGNAATKMNFYGSHDGQTWEQIGNTYSFANDAVLLRAANFPGNVTYRYIRGDAIEVGGRVAGGTAKLAEVAFVKAKTCLTSESEQTIDIMTSEADVSYAFEMYGATAVTGIELGGEAISTSAYTFSEDTLTILNSYIKTLDKGSYVYTVSFDNGDTVDVTVIVENFTITDYKLQDTEGAGTSELVLSIPDGKTVTAVAYGETPIDEAEYAFDADADTLTIGRIAFRSLDKLYIMDSIVLTVSFDDETTQDYTVRLSSDWKTVGTVVASGFKADEIVSNANWKVKTDSALAGYTPETMFRGVVSGYTNWHSWYDSTGTPDHGRVADRPYYLDVDMTAAQTFSGLRYYARSSGGTAGVWSDVTVYGANDYTQDMSGWTQITSSTAFTQTQKSVDDISFGSNVTYRYFRVVINRSAYATGNMVTLLKPEVASTEATVTHTLGTSDAVSYTFTDAGLTLTAVYDETGAEVADVNYSFASGVFNFTTSYVNALEAASHSYKLIFGDKYANVGLTTIPGTRALTIHYVYAGGEKAKDDYTATLNNNDEYNVASPEITGYTADKLSVAGTITEDTVVTVTYTINSYEITWIVDGVETKANADYNTLPTYAGTPAKATSPDGAIAYTFTGWTPEVINATANATYTAEFAEGKSVDKLAAEAVETLIAAIGNVFYTPECTEKINAARTAYDALTAIGKTLTSNYAVLTSTEASYATMKADAETAQYVIDVEPTAGGSVTKDETPVSGTVTADKGEEVTITATPETNASFKYWIDAKTKKILSESQVLKMSIYSKRSINAVFDNSSTDSVLVTFRGKYDSLVKTDYIESGANAVAPESLRMYASGYDFIGWDKSTDNITVATDFNAKYEKKNIAYTVTVEGGTLENNLNSNTYLYNEKATVTAGAAEQGMVFAGWTIGGEIVSYDSNYTFHVTRTLTITATYATILEKQASISIATSSSVEQATNIAHYQMVNTVPDDCTIIEKGIIYAQTGSAGSTDLLLANIGTKVSGRTIKIAVSKLSALQFTLSAAYDAQGIAARGYMIYKNASNEIITKYSNVYYIAQ